MLFRDLDLISQLEGQGIVRLFGLKTGALMLRLGAAAVCATGASVKGLNSSNFLKVAVASIILLSFVSSFI